MLTFKHSMKNQNNRNSSSKPNSKIYYESSTDSWTIDFYYECN